MAQPAIEVEDFVLYVRTFNLGAANAQQQAVYNRNIAKVKLALRTITDCLDVLSVANRHGWDIAMRLIERHQTGEDREIQLAIDDVKKQTAEKAKQERRDRDRRRDRSYRRYDSPSPRRYRSRSRSPIRRSRRRSRERSRDRSPTYSFSSSSKRRRDRSRDNAKGKCFNCRRTRHYIQDCPRK